MILHVFAAALWFTMKIGESLFSRRVGLWAAIFTGFMPYFFLKTVEFRTDDLWTAVWLGAVALAVGGPLTLRRMFGVGLALGTAFGVSMKTTLLALALLLAGVMVAVLWRWTGGELRVRAVSGRLAAGLVGLFVVPGAIVAYYAAHHALKLLYYRAIGHNLLPASAHASHFAARLFLFPLAVPVLLFAGREVFRRIPDRMAAARRSFVLHTAFFFLALLHSYWPMITAQDYPPIIPLFIVLITPGVLAEGPAGVAWGRHWVSACTLSCCRCCSSHSRDRGRPSGSSSRARGWAAISSISAMCSTSPIPATTSWKRNPAQSIVGGPFTTPWKTSRVPAWKGI